tara:strand:+ start:3729 stop:3923 length:195 start_codon:yes stop_codon:yes gene_type:complete
MSPIKKKYDSSKQYVATVGIDIDETKEGKAAHYEAGEIIKDAPGHFDWEGLITVNAIEVVKGGK